LTQRQIKLLSGSYTLQFFNTREQTQKIAQWIEIQQSTKIKIKMWWV